ncbi:trihydroxytoluene oxygenase [Xylogone sp. PMI_703]|nr:trihydroxytoluene oxygenase [Xylogone sp. PMI_703]
MATAVMSQTALEHPKPNRGATVAEHEAVKSDVKLRDWQKKVGIDRSKQVKIVRISHMRYQHPDLDIITTFLQDFGMTVVNRTDDEVWYEGYGPDPYVYYAKKGEKKYLGGTFLVESMAELEKAQKLPGAGEITKLDNAPGGGFMLTIIDPEGFPINLIYGQVLKDDVAYPPNLVYNYESEKPRVRGYQRFTPGPAAVHKLGHFGLCIKDFKSELDFYTRNFNFAPTDFLYVDENDDPSKRKDVAVFMHIDRGTECTDHHTLFLSTNPTSHVHHCSFEVHDFDTQNLGHQWLEQKGYNIMWGVGRHILGSQIFDYWWDPTGNMIEHYADGDLVTEETPIGWGPAGDEALAVWGPDVPKTFLD